MRNGLKIAFFFLIAPALSVAQNSAPPSPAPDSGQNPAPTEKSAPIALRQPPAAAGYASVLSVNAGYSITGLMTPLSAGAALIGVDMGASLDFSTHFGAELNFDYASASNFMSSGHRLDQFSYLIGPTFHFANESRLNPHLYFLVGGARTTGPAPSAGGGFITGYVNYPAWAVGGRIEYPFARSWAVRVSVDYMRTYFFDSSITARGQNGLRVANSIVYYFSGPSIRFRHRR